MSSPRPSGITRLHPAVVVLAGVLLLAVGAAAAVLSFDGLTTLARESGGNPDLAWLLPVAVDAGVVLATGVWLAHGYVPDDARRFARALTLALLTVSVLGNGVAHLLTAYAEPAPVPLVFVVGGIGAGVLGAVIHMLVLAVRTPPPARTPAPPVVAPYRGGVTVSLGAPVSEPARTPGATDTSAVRAPATAPTSATRPPAGAPTEPVDADGYTAAVRALAVRGGVDLEPAVPGETAEERRRRVARGRARARRAAEGPPVPPPLPDPLPVDLVKRERVGAR